MNITKIQTREFHRSLRTPMKTSRGTIDHRSGIVIAVQGIDGYIGFGEVNFPLFPDSGDYEREITSIKDMLTATLAGIEGLPIPPSLDDITAGLKPLLPATHPAVYFGVETALCDLAAKVVEQPLRKWLYSLAIQTVPVNFLVPRPVEDWEKFASFVRKHGYRSIKAKVGGHSIDEDISFTAKLRETLGDDIAIRLDANRGWDIETATTVCHRLREYNVDYIEEPLATFSIDRLSSLSKETNIRFALDESLAEIEDIDTAMTSPMPPILIIKPARLGGIAASITLIRRAQKCGCMTVITSNLETEIGTAALLHLAAIFDDIPPCGLDTIRMFENPDPALTDIKDGSIELPPGPGIGLGETLWKSL